MTTKYTLAGVVEAVIKAYAATGRLAFYHPRKGTISLNGGRPIPVKDALIKMLDVVEPS